MHLNNIIVDPNKRKPIYQIFAAIGLLITAVQVAFSAAQVGQPVWLTVTLAVYAFLAGAGFTLAQAHTYDDLDELEESIYDIADEDPDEDNF